MSDEDLGRGMMLGVAQDPSDKPVVLCAGDKLVTSVDYCQPGHPRSVHADGSLCDHAGPIRIGTSLR